MKVVASVIILILLIAALLPFLHDSQSLGSESLTMVEKTTNPPANEQFNQSLRANDTFAFYYPWYGTPSVSGYWYHWNDSGHNPDNVTDGKRDIAATDYPLDDVYDSNNETVIDQQVKEAKDAGINCFVISWWGINDFTDNASEHIMNVCERDDFNFTFYIENTTSVSQTVEDLTYLFSTYGNSSSWYRVDGRPIIFVYQRTRDELNPQTWIWHACTNSSGIDLNPNQTESASSQWLLAEEIRAPPRFGIISFQPFKTTPGYVETANSTYLPPNEQYMLNVGVSDIRNDSGINSTVGIEIKIGTDPTCNDTLYNQTLHFSDGWQDLSFNVTAYAGQDVYLRVESYAVGWTSEWAAVDYFYVTNSSGKIVSSDPLFDNGWNETIYEIRAKGYTPYVIMDFGGYENKLEDFIKLKDFIDYFSNCVDGIHMYNPKGFSNNLLGLYDLYDQASELAHSYDKTFIASVVPGFNNTVASDYSSTSLESVVDRRNGGTYDSFWLIANASHPDGYAITSFNEWHEGTEIEPSIEYNLQYLNLTKEILKTGAQIAAAAQALPFAVNYLVRNYNSTIRLIPDVPGSSTYWLYSDNFLASYTLWRYDPTNLTLENIVTNISKSISKYIQTVPDLLNQYMVLNASIAAFNGSSDYTIGHYGDAIINITLNNGTGPLYPYDYADIAFLEALYYHSIGQVQNASDAYQNGTSMFNGKGLNDTTFQNESKKGQYQTFKVALYVYASKVLGQQFPLIAEATLLKMQAASGGFYTGYDENYSTNGTNTNVETTSLAILALLEPSGGTININADGSIFPPIAPITTVDNVTYTFVGDINGSIVVQRNGIIVDGNGYMLQGPGNGTGFSLSGVTNVTIKNTTIADFTNGIWLNYSSNDVLFGNAIAANDIGIWLGSSSLNIITNNDVVANNYCGIALYSSSNNTISVNNVTGNGYGIYLNYSSNNTITANNATENNSGGIYLDYSSNNTVTGNNVTNNRDGITLYYSSNNTLGANSVTTNDGEGIYLNSFSNNNTIAENSVTANKGDGIYFDSSSNNAVTGNSIAANKADGIDLILASSNNTFAGNDVTNNWEGIGLGSSSNNNTITGNNVTSNQENAIVFSYSTSNNTISVNNVTGNGYGIYLELSPNDKVTGNNVTANNMYGIVFFMSYNGTLSGNNIAANDIGIWLISSSNNAVTGNSAAANKADGIRLQDSSNNMFAGNTVANNLNGIFLEGSSYNNIWHNNFLNNTSQFSRDSLSANVWDDGYPSGGNYWSDYHGTDSYGGSYQNETGSDGIGDTGYAIGGNSTDHYPLMGMFSEFDWISLVSPEQRIQTICNSTISNLIYNGTAISFDVTGDKGTSGFCRIQIPKVFMNGAFAVFVNGTEIAYTRLSSSNENITYLYFNYTHSTEQVIIVPEFPSFLILPLFMIATLLAVMIYRKKGVKTR